MTIIESFLRPGEIHSARSSDCDGEEFQSRVADVIVGGPDDSKIHVAEAVTAYVSGSGDWESVFGDAMIAAAILDRLLHPPTTADIRGESYRS
jgi:hypothetical protein